MQQPLASHTRAAFPVSRLVVALVIPSYRRPDLVRRCLDSLQLDGFSGERRVVVVEDGPDLAEQSLELQKRPGVTVRSMGRNTGFAAAANDGLRAALDIPGVDAIGLLNNDVVVAPAWLDALGAALVDYGWDYAVPRMCFLEDVERIDGDGDVLDRDGVARRRNRGQYARLAGQAPQPVSFPTGGASLVLRRAWERVGLYDERLGMYYEDVDWGVRAAAAGLTGGVVPAAVVYHAGGQSSDRAYAVTQCFVNHVRVSIARFPARYFTRHGHRWALGVVRSFRYTVRVAGLRRTMAALARTVRTFPESCRRRRDIGWTKQARSAFLRSLG